MNDEQLATRERWPTDVSTYRVDAGLRTIVQGVGCVRDRLGAELDAQHVRRPLIVCGENVRRSPAFITVCDAVESATGVAPRVFADSRPHSPSDAIEAGARFARGEGVDGIVAVGGSSSIDTAKGMAVLLATGIACVAELTAPSPGALSTANETPPGLARMPVFTATTTLSYAEFFAFWGTRRTDIGEKRGYGDHGVVSRTIFLDGEIAASTPDTVWFETAVKSLDDALLVYLRSSGAEPFLDPLLIAGIRGVIAHLHESAADPTGIADAAARQRVLTAMALTKYPAPRTRAGFSSDWFARAVRYALGSLYALPHGVGTCIALTRGLRFHHAETAARQRTLALALGLRDGVDDHDPADALVGAFADLLEPLGLARNFADVGLGDEQVAAIVDHIAKSMPGLGARDDIAAAVDQLRDATGPVSSRP